MAGVQGAVARLLRSYAADLEGCLVYLDAGAAEAVAAAVGLSALHELGVAAVCDLAAASPADLATAALLLRAAPPVRRVTCLVTALLADAEAAVLAACALHAAAAQFTVLCAVSQAAHHDEQPGVYGGGCYGAVAASWQQRLNEGRGAAGHGPCSLVVRHCPLVLCPLGSSAFVLAPSCAAAALPRVAGLAAGCSPGAEAAAEGESDDEATDARSSAAAGGATSGLAVLAHALAGVAATLGHRPEAFALGPCSRAVCSGMAFVPTLAEGAPPAALVLVDRLLDPVSPSQHADLLVQRLFDLLQPADRGASQGGAAATATGGGGGGGAAGGQLPMPCLDAPLRGSSDGDGSGVDSGSASDGGGPGSLLAGSLGHPGDPQAERWLEFLLSRRGRDAAMFVRKWLREAARKENVPQGQRFKPGSITAAELRSLADGLRRQGPAAARRHSALLQLAEATAAAAEGPHAGGLRRRRAALCCMCRKRWEALHREERALLFACAESSQAAATQLAELCQLAGDPGSPLRLADVPPLVLAAYCLLPDFLPWYAAGEGGAPAAFQPQQEAQLRQALVAAVLASTDAEPAAAATIGDEAAAGAAPQPADWPLAGLCRRAALAAGKRGAGSGAAGGEGEEGDASGRDVAAQELAALGEEAGEAVDGLLGRMRQLAAFRHSQLKHAKRLAVTGEDGTPAHAPLLRQIAELVLRDQPVPDLHAGATSLSGLLRSGLGRIGLQAGPKPSDCSTVILFVVGGISLAELHLIMQAADERAAQHVAAAGAGTATGAAAAPPPRMIVGATALLQPGDGCARLFADL